jgi:hypothetical protein
MLSNRLGAVTDHFVYFSATLLLQYAHILNKNRPGRDR